MAKLIIPLRVSDVTCSPPREGFTPYTPTRTIAALTGGSILCAATSYYIRLYQAKDVGGRTVVSADSTSSQVIPGSAYALYHSGERLVTELDLGDRAGVAVLDSSSCRLLTLFDGLFHGRVLRSKTVFDRVEVTPCLGGALVAAKMKKAERWILAYLPPQGAERVLASGDKASIIGWRGDWAVALIESAEGLRLLIALPEGVKEERAGFKPDAAVVVAGKLVALKASRAVAVGLGTSRKSWEVEVSGAPRVAGATSKHVVFYGPGKVVALDAETGEKAWERGLEVEGAYAYEEWVLAWSKRKLLILDEDGRTLCELRYPSDIIAASCSSSSLLVALQPFGEVVELRAYSLETPYVAEVPSAICVPLEGEARVPVSVALNAKLDIVEQAEGVKVEASSEGILARDAGGEPGEHRVLLKLSTPRGEECYASLRVYLGEKSRLGRIAEVEVSGEEVVVHLDLEEPLDYLYASVAGEGFQAWTEEPEGAPKGRVAISVKAGAFEKARLRVCGASAGKVWVEERDVTGSGSSGSSSGGSGPGPA